MSRTWQGAGRWGRALPDTRSPPCLLAASCASCPNAEVRGGRLVTLRMAEPRARGSLVPSASHTAQPALSLVASFRQELKLRRAKWLWSAVVRASQAESQVPTVEEPSEKRGPLMALEASRPVGLGPGPFPHHTPKAWLRPAAPPQGPPTLGLSTPARRPCCRLLLTSGRLRDSPEVTYLAPAPRPPPRWPLPATSVWPQGSPEVTMAATALSESIDETAVCEVTSWGRVAGDQWRWN